MAEHAAGEDSPGTAMNGFVLALLFSVVYGGVLGGGLLAEHVFLAGGALNDHVIGTVSLIGISGALAAFFAWGVQGMGASFPFVGRFVFALFFLGLLFVVIGGGLTMMYGYLPFPAKVGPTYQFTTFEEFIATGLTAMHAFVRFFLEPLRASLLALLPAGGLVIALFGPQRP